MKFLVGIILSAVMFLTWTATVYAADTANATCLDTDNDGVFDVLKASGMPDRDCDGYTTAQGDCDDTNYRVWPGEWITTGCSAGQYKQCDAGGSGSYGSCTADSAIDESTNSGGGGGHRYYVDAGTGNNANTGTFASPWADYSRVCNYESVGLRPANWVDLAPGDVVYLKGTTNLTATYASGGSIGSVFCRLENTQAGNSSHPVRFYRLPGSTAEIRSSGSVIFQFEGGGAGYVHFKRLAGGFSGGGKFIYLNWGGNNSTLEGLNLYDSTCPADGNGDNCNHIGSAAGAKNLTIVRNRFGEIYDPDYYSNNVSMIVHFDTDNNIIRYNQFIMPNAWNYGGVRRSQGWKVKKDQNNGSTIGAWFEYNRGINLSGFMAETCEKYSHVTHNLCINCEGLYNASNLGSGANQTYSDHDVSYNTFVSSIASSGSTLGFQWSHTLDNPGPTNFDHNIIVGASGSNAVQIMNYGTNTQFSTVCGGAGPSCTSGLLTFGNNCYYSTGTAPSYNLFSDVGSGSAGATYSFGNWIGTVGLDATSHNENPSLDSYQRATSSNCASRGWSLQSEAGPTPTPTATATPTASPTPTATPTATVAPLIGRCRKGQVRTTGPGNKY